MHRPSNVLQIAIVEEGITVELHPHSNLFYTDGPDFRYRITVTTWHIRIIISMISLKQQVNHLARCLGCAPPYRYRWTNTPLNIAFIMFSISSWFSCSWNAGEDKNTWAHFVWWNIKAATAQREVTRRHRYHNKTVWDGQLCCHAAMWQMETLWDLLLHNLTNILACRDWANFEKLWVRPVQHAIYFHSFLQGGKIWPLHVVIIYRLQ